jgi:predicted transcriptional regulator
MATERLEIRLDAGYRRKLDEIARRRGAPVSTIVRQMIDRLYDEVQHEEPFDSEKRRAERHTAVQRMIASEIEDVPDPEELNRQLDGRIGLRGDLR